MEPTAILRIPQLHPPADMPRVYLYVVDRDYGFAPNPFHGVCTLATCKPSIRSTAKVGDWIIGVGGGQLKASGKCIFAMNVTQKLTFNQYWNDARFASKKPVRNGSKKMMMGDNIYVQNPDSSWQQLPSHHSNVDGSINYSNVIKDTRYPNVLISSHFYYFGINALTIPETILTNLGYKNRRGHRVYDHNAASDLIDWIEGHNLVLNKVAGDPFDFDKSTAHYSAATNKISYS